MDFAALLTAVGLLLVIEGLGPFLAPRGMRKLYRLASEVPDAQLRVIGIVSMLLGLVIVSWVRHG